MCVVTFNPNVNVSLCRGEREREKDGRTEEMESGCVRKSQKKDPLLPLPECVGVGSERRRDGEKERQAACVFMLCRD